MKYRILGALIGRPGRIVFFRNLSFEEALYICERHSFEWLDHEGTYDLWISEEPEAPGTIRIEESGKEENQ